MERVDRKKAQAAITPAGNKRDKDAALIAAIAEQVKRFEGHTNFGDALQKELFGAIQRVVKTEAEAIALGDTLMQRCTFCPVPADVYAAMAEVERGSERLQSTYRDPRKPPDCVKCNDTGFVRVKQEKENESGATGVEFCECHPARKEEQGQCS